MVVAGLGRWDVGIGLGGGGGELWEARWSGTSRLNSLFREEEKAGDQGLTKVYGPNFGALINFMLHWNLNGGC